MVRSAIELGHYLGLHVVEGVEDDQTLDAPAQLGCDRVQGYLTGRAMPASALPGRLAARAEQTRAEQTAPLR